MKNIFKNAYFGRPYKARDGREALYRSYDDFYPDFPYRTHHDLILGEEDGVRVTVWIWCNDYGHVEEHVEGEWLYETNSDIISEWKEEINEEELNKLAELESPFCFEEEDFTERNKFYQPAFVKGFKAGYLKRMEE